MVNLESTGEFVFLEGITGTKTCDNGSQYEYNLAKIADPTVFENYIVSCDRQVNLNQIPKGAKVLVKGYLSTRGKNTGFTISEIAVI